MRRLLKFWFTFEGPVSRRIYLRHGAALMLVKYLTDAAVVWWLAGATWLPTDYVTTGSALEHSKLAGGPAALPLILGLWTVPFLWAGLTLTTRRALDAKMSPWFALLFVVPVVNYMAMVVLCALPSAPEPSPGRAPRSDGDKYPAQMAGLGAGVGTGVALVLLGILALKTYGAALFVGTPFLMGVSTAYVFNRSYPATKGETTQTVIAAIVLVAGALLFFAIEGVACLIMALPLAVLTAWLGSKLGRFIARESAVAPAHLALVLFISPLAMPIVDARSPVLAHEVRSAVEIAATPDVVWRNVVVFPRMDAPRELLFRSGIAYPVGARIEGRGVGAIRYCEFSTGPFVEPITVWEPSHRLAFGVAQQPAPMREWSPYHIAPPHLDGYFRAVRGEFRLVPLANGNTRLEGSTWYELDVHPAPYFAMIADYIVGRIHRRVLTHIKAVAESSGAGGAWPAALR